MQFASWQLELPRDLSKTWTRLRSPQEWGIHWEPEATGSRETRLQRFLCGSGRWLSHPGQSHVWAGLPEWHAYPWLFQTSGEPHVWRSTREQWRSNRALSSTTGTQARTPDTCAVPSSPAFKTLSDQDSLVCVWLKISSVLMTQGGNKRERSQQQQQKNH